MEISSLAVRLVWTTALSVGIQMPSFSFLESGNTNKEQVKSEVIVEDGYVDSYGKLVCKSGFKAGKTAVSLVPGAKVSCYNVAAAAAGKKLLIKVGNTCFACHMPGGINPYTAMIGNLRTQAFTLKPASITAAFAAHADQMSGAVMTAKDAKNISAFLQSIKG